MSRKEIVARLLDGTSDRWHWWAWHFKMYDKGFAIPFVDALVDALLAIEAKMAGYAERMVDVIVSIGGRERHYPDYEQLLQVLAEIHVAYHVVEAAWPRNSTFAAEPVAAGSARNPELVVSTDEFRLGVEVKAPALLEHEKLRSSRPLQAGGRIFQPSDLQRIAGGKENVTLPRDNPVKDFLVSADGKFASFRKADDRFFGVLVIVWDDFVYEPITALLHPSSGLLTENSFARSGDGPLRYPDLDAILVLSHLQWLKRALGEGHPDVPMAMSRRAFEWDFDVARPAALVVPPGGRGLPEGVGALLDVHPVETIPGAEYRPSDLVQWLNVDPA